MHKDLIEIKKDILNYIPIIYKEYDVDLRLIKYLVDNIDNRITFSLDTISFFVRDDVLNLPEISYRLFNKFKEEPEYDTEVDTGVKAENYLDTNTTYYEYINHVIRDGLEPVDYFKENLLHEVMHMCGGGGGNPLQEGINELKTRELAQKHNLKIAAVGYQKEVEIAKQLQDIIGKDIMDKIEFMSPIYSAMYIEDHVGKEEANLYNNIYKGMKRASNKYSSVLGIIRDPYEKAKIYEEVNYDSVKEIIRAYNEDKKVI